MVSVDANIERYRIGDLIVDIAGQRVTRNGQEIPLPNLSFDLLKALIRHAPNVVTHDQIMDEVWPGLVVSPETISKRANLLRARLRDDSGDPRYIELVRGRGYRLAQDVEKLPRVPAPPKSGYRTVFIGAIVIALAVVIFLIPTESPRDKSVAVLPFENLTGDPQDQVITDGVHYDLLTQLVKIADLKSISRTSVMQYRDTEKTIPQIADELGVATIMEGGVQRAGDSIRINVQLIDAATDEQLWAETYDRELSAENIFAIQSEIATSVARELQATLSNDEVARVKVLPTRSTRAYDLYIRGRFFWNQRTKEGFNRALDYYNQAIEVDPMYALAYAGVASTYVLMGHELYSFSHPRDSYPKAQAAARKALELDETVAEAHSVLGYASLVYDWDFVSSDREHQRAIALNPNYSTGHQWYSHYLLPMGHVNDSLDSSQRALELDPLNVVMNMHLGWHYFYAGENELAIKQLQQTLELRPTYVVAILFLGQVFEQEMRLEEAIEQFEKAVDLSHRNPVHLAALAHAFAISGKQKAAESLLEELLSSEQYVPSYEVAVVYAGLNRQDDALTWLERAYDEKDSSWLVDVALDPRFQQLHSVSRFQSLTRRLGLP